MGLDDALIFTRVVEHHSFTQAAQSLGMQKSTVSRRIALLEERLGVRLLNRTTRKLRLTEVGQAYYERCRQIMHDFAEAEQAVMQLQQAPSGLLRITFADRVRPDVPRQPAGRLHAPVPADHRRGRAGLAQRRSAAGGRRHRDHGRPAGGFHPGGPSPALYQPLALRQPRLPGGARHADIGGRACRASRGPVCPPTPSATGRFPETACPASGCCPATTSPSPARRWSPVPALPRYRR
ncbi:transcriptional regulator [Pseudomonas aeruginosa]|nr:transcriptional regulator [Pseudomonas aeruginosa]